MLVALSGNGGYQPGSHVSYDTYTKKYQTMFTSPEAVASPEVEFVELFADAIQGQNWFATADLQTSLGQKRQVVQAIFNRLVPGGNNYEEFADAMGNYGDPGGFNLQDLARQIPDYVTLLNSARSVEEQKTIENLWGEGETVRQIRQDIGPSSSQQKTETVQSGQA
ncbi:MAG TPA: hypothetical protein VIH90_05140 [Candidatus Saccharimonadales bacterium]